MTRIVPIPDELLPKTVANATFDPEVLRAAAVTACRSVIDATHFQVAPWVVLYLLNEWERHLDPTEPGEPEPDPDAALRLSEPHTLITSEDGDWRLDHPPGCGTAHNCVLSSFLTASLYTSTDVKAIGPPGPYSATLLKGTSLTGLVKIEPLPSPDPTPEEPPHRHRIIVTGRGRIDALIHPYACNYEGQPCPIERALHPDFTALPYLQPGEYSLVDTDIGLRLDPSGFIIPS